MNKKHPFVGPFLLLIVGILLSYAQLSWAWLVPILLLYGNFFKGKWLIHWGFLSVLFLPGFLGYILMQQHQGSYAKIQKDLQIAPSLLIRIKHVEVLNSFETKSHFDELSASSAKRCGKKNTERTKLQVEILAVVDQSKVEFLPETGLGSILGIGSGTRSGANLEIDCPSELIARPTKNDAGDWLDAIVLIDGWKLSQSNYLKFPRHKIYLNSNSNWLTVSDVGGYNALQKIQYWAELKVATEVKMCLSENAWNLFLKLMLGQKGAIDSSEMRYFQKAGIIHVLSVSGMHVALIFSVLFWPLKWIRLRWIHRITWLFIMLTIWIYGSITGMSPPVERAVWAITYSQIGQQFFQRKIWIADSFFLVGCLQLMMDPLMIFDVGFQLSYAAMAGIALVVPFYNECMLLKDWPKWKENIISGIVISFVCSITTLPIVLYYFKQFSNWFMVGNLLLIPLFTVLIYGFLGLLVFAFFGLFQLIPSIRKNTADLFDLLLVPIKRILTFIDELPFGYSYAPSFSGIHALLLSILVIFWIHRIHFPNERKWTFWAVIPFLILVSL